MNEPPDIGGSPPEVAYNITIDNMFSKLDESSKFSKLDESSMDTDVDQRSDRKRARPNKICKHCNKRKKRCDPMRRTKLKDTDCSCQLPEIPLIDTELSNAKSLDGFPSTVMSTNTISTNIHQYQPPPSEVSQSPNNPVNASHPPVSIGRSLYEAYDIGPFVVHVQKIATDKEIPSLHPVQFGYFLKQSSIKNIINGSIKRIGRNRISLSFSEYKYANDFINNPCLARNNFKSFIPSFNVTRMGLVRGVPAEWSPEEILDNISLPVGSGKIIKIRRLNYKVRNSTPPEWKPSQTIVITFDGQALPKHVFVCYNALPVELYSYPTIQCYSCCRFGHTKTKCNSRPRCYKCGQGHTGDTCDIEDDSAYCCLCSGLHFATNRKCPEYERQTKIKLYMAQRCVSYTEANKAHEPVSKSFADIVKLSNLQNTPNSPVSPASPSSPSIPSYSRSYRKTTFAKPSSPRPKRLGYNKREHFNLIKDYDAPPPSNGVALNGNSNNSETMFSISDVIQLLTEIKSISNSNQNNVTEQRRPTIDSLTQLKSSYASRTRTNNPVEL
ncbi:uncharacterized protein [Choristoneura fumiferana]|uniref:uncharacterized protein n=1 Tax=Choristoneura fumiferana TaxID=7141 RepID=UPI003D15C009